MRKIIFTVFAVLILTGCKSSSLPNKAALQTRANTVGEAIPPPTNDVAEFEAGGKTTEERAQAIAALVTDMSEIERASVVITGKNAIVGIEIAGELDDRKLIKLKTQVEKEIRKMDPDISHVAVTASADLVQRITNITDSVTVDDKPPVTDEHMQEVIRKLTPPV